tara:strand:+ start:112 stop:363 length:252 start_codon:yes stop_codon:yes gene_type:complete
MGIKSKISKDALHNGFDVLNSYVVLDFLILFKLTPLPSDTFFFALSIPLTGLSFEEEYLKKSFPHEFKKMKKKQEKTIFLIIL